MNNTEELMTNKLLKSSDNLEKNCFHTGPVLQIVNRLMHFAHR